MGLLVKMAAMGFTAALLAACSSSGSSTPSTAVAPASQSRASTTVSTRASRVKNAATNNLTVTLNQLNNSGESGTATLTQNGADVQVVITLASAPATAQPAHIHNGTCASPGSVNHALTNVVNGDSTTTVSNTTIDQLLAQPFSIDAHRSTMNNAYVACGNITTPAL